MSDAKLSEILTEAIRSSSSVVTDASGRIVYVSRAFLDSIGLEPSSCIGSSPPYPWWSPEESKFLGELIQLVLSGTADMLAGVELPVTNVRADGTRTAGIVRFKRIADGYVVYSFDSREHSTQRVVRAAEELGELARAVLDSGVESRRSDHRETDLRERVQGLSQREKEICELLLQGKRPTEIAEALLISVHTVKNHARSVFRKLRVRSQLDLLAKYRPPARRLAGAPDGKTGKPGTERRLHGEPPERE